MKRAARSALVALSVYATFLLFQTASAYVLRSWSVVTTSTTPFTGTPPSADCNLAEASPMTTGLRLSDCSAYYVCVYAAAAQTLSGAGKLDAYFWEPLIPAQTWESDATETIPLSASGQRFHCFTQRKLQKGSVGCGYWNPSGVTTSGGTTVTVVARCIQ